MSILELTNPQPADQTPSASDIVNTNPAILEDTRSGRMTGISQPRSAVTYAPSLPNNPGSTGSAGSPGITIGSGETSGAPELPNAPDGQDMSRFNSFGELNDDYANGDEDNSLFVDVLANDIGAVTVLSIFSATQTGEFTYRLASGAIVTITNNGVVYNANGNVEYLSPTNGNSLDSFSYQAMLQDGSILAAKVRIFVAGVNDAPVANDDVYSVAKNQTLLVSPASGVLDNDNDVDSGSLSSRLFSGPAHGTLALNPDGSFSYTPEAGFSGQDSFVYNLSDGDLSDLATVTINVLNIIPISSFESGFAGWMTTSGTDVLSISNSRGPTDGSFFAHLTDGDNGVGSIESFLGLAGGSFNAASGVNIFDGSAIKTTFNVVAGQTVRFDWRIDGSDSSFPDRAFFVFGGDIVNVQPTGSTTEWQTFEINSTVTGPVTLGFAMMNGGDSIVLGNLLIDNVTLFG